MPKKESDGDSGAIYLHVSGPLAAVWERSRAKAEQLRVSLRQRVEESDVAWEVVAQRAGMSPEELGHVLRAPGYLMTLDEMDQILRAAEIDPWSFFDEQFPAPGEES